MERSRNKDAAGINADYQRMRLRLGPSLLRELDRAIQGCVREHGCDEKDAVRDMLIDVRHLCDVYGVNFAEADQEAYDGYFVESAEEWRAPVMSAGEKRRRPRTIIC